MCELSVEIAALRVAIVTRCAEVAGVIRDRYKGFLSAGSPDWRIEISTEPASQSPVAEDVVVEREADSARFTVRRQDFAGSIDLSSRSGKVSLVDPDEVSMDAFLRVAYSLMLTDAQGLVVHAASLVRGDKAYLFCGPSGSGKTTLARLSQDAILLSDELSIVRVSGGSAVCYGTPFWGELARGGQSCSAPLAGIYFLRKSGHHARQGLGPRHALERLLPNVLFFTRDAALTARVLGISADVVGAAPGFELSFRPDPGVWATITSA